jgi:hypothetical protein
MTESDAWNCNQMKLADPCFHVRRLAQAAPLSAKYHASGSGGQRNSGIVGFRSDNSQDIFDVLRAQGGCCDCEILCNVPLSRDYTIGGSSSKGQRSGSTDRLTAHHTFFLQLTDESPHCGPRSVRRVCLSCVPRMKPNNPSVVAACDDLANFARHRGTLALSPTGLSAGSQGWS